MEGFFQAGSFLDEIEVKELLLHRYSNIEYILSMDLYEGILFYNKAKEKDTEDKLFSMWVQLYPRMNKDSFVSWGDYYTQCTKKSITNKSNEDILKESEEILKHSQKRGDEQWH